MGADLPAHARFTGFFAAKAAPTGLLAAATGRLRQQAECPIDGVPQWKKTVESPQLWGV